jgi:2-keto-4-pentenoate hydratase/2-oxohepta-3-ene-1,7-dioic acid hydratase in catechol pathway
VEAELAIVVKEPIWCATIEEASKAIFGYVVANDVTAKNIYGRDHHLARSKSLPSFCPISDILISGISTQDLKITTRINGKVTQQSSTSKKILSDAECLSLVSRIVPLIPGDLVLTGTPFGASDSVVEDGDLVVLEIENVGIIRNRVVSS